MLDRFEPGLDIEITGTIDPTGFGIRVLNSADSDVGRRRQIAFPVLRPQIIATPLPLPGSSTLAADSLAGCHRRIALASKRQTANGLN